MYIFKNALLNIVRTKGRNILISLIILTISISACIGLSIRQAAETAKNDSLENLSITAKISIDRSSLMQSSGTSTDKSSFDKTFSGMNSLTLDDMLQYAEAQSVKSFYYTETIGLNASENIVPFTTSSTDTSTSTYTGMTGKGSKGVTGDFTLIGYSSHEAMTTFNNGTCTITEGVLFEENSDNLDCVISDELATYNGLSVGNTLVLTNPNDDSNTFTLNIVGIYNNSQSGVSSFGTSDPANQIYLTSAAINTIISSSASDEVSTAITSQTSGTYTFATLEDYNVFESEARELGLNEMYIISSSDVSSYEQSLAPLNNLSSMAGYFLVVIIAIGALILVVLNIFSIRERKYEVGVLTAIGMKKWKVATQFIIEILIISLLSVSIGGAIGAVSSVPVTNSLLQSQVTEQQQEAEESLTNSYSNGGRGGKLMNSFSQTTDYVSEVSSAVNITVLFQLLGLFMLLTLLSGAVSVIFIMRYEPLKILSNRD